MTSRPSTLRAGSRRPAPQVVLFVAKDAFDPDEGDDEPTTTTESTTDSPAHRDDHGHHDDVQQRGDVLIGGDDDARGHDGVRTARRSTGGSGTDGSQCRGG